MLSNENYFSLENQQKYMSVSQFKMFEKCPAMALAYIKGDYMPDKTVSLLVGSYVDAYFEGALDRFREENPQIYKRDGTLKSEYIKADQIIARIEQDPLFVSFLSGEKQVIMTGTISDIPVKIKVDSLHSDKIVDLKIMADFEPKYKPEQGKLHWAEYWGYDLQGAVYQEIVRQNTGNKLPFFLAAATKEKVTDIDIVQIPQSYLDVMLEHFEDYVTGYDAIKMGLIEPERCEKCDYCKATKVLTEPRMIGAIDYE